MDLGLKVNGETRSWQDIPLPERLGLAREILQQREAIATKSEAL